MAQIGTSMRGYIVVSALLALVMTTVGCTALFPRAGTTTEYRLGSATILELTGAPADVPAEKSPLPIQDGSGYYGQVLGANMTFGQEDGWQVIINALGTDSGGDIFVVAPGGWSASGREHDQCQVEHAPELKTGIHGRVTCQNMRVRRGEATGSSINLTAEFEANP